MKPIMLSLALGAFVYCLGFQASVMAQYGSPSPSYPTVSPPAEYPTYSPSPKYGGSPSPSPVYEYSPSPVYGTPSPDQGYSPSPDQGYSPSPDQGYSPSPDQGYSPSPDQGYSPSPDQGYSPSPDQGYSPSPDQGYSPSPDQGYSPSPDQGYSPSPVYGEPPVYSPPPIYNEPPKYGETPVYGVPPSNGGYEPKNPGYGYQPQTPSGYTPEGGYEPKNPGYGNQPTYPSGGYTPQGGYGPQNPPTDTSIDCHMAGGYPGSGSGPYTPGSGSGPYTPSSGSGPYTPSSGSGPYTPGSGSGPQTPGSGSVPSGPGTPASETPGSGTVPGVPPSSDPIPHPMPITVGPGPVEPIPEQCLAQCTRRSVKDWSPKDWELYAQLFKEANARGHITELTTIHAGKGVSPAFHTSIQFLPWHRMFLNHLEKLLQQIDGEINKGRAASEGQFCLGFWDWGYHEDQSGDIMNAVYNYLFNDNAVGALQPGLHGIPEGLFKDFTVEEVGLVDREPKYQENAWTFGAITTCLAENDFEVIRDGHRVGFSQCLEDTVHNPVHNAVSGKMASSLTSSSDPVFWLHHTMVDYLWWVWQKEADNTYPQDFAISAPYGDFTLNEAKDYSKMCYTYQESNESSPQNMPQMIASPPSMVATPPPMVGTPPAMGMSPMPQTVTKSYSALSAPAQKAVAKTLKEGEPQVIPRERMTFLRSHASSEEMFESMYQEYILTVYKIQVRFQLIFETYGAEYTQITGETIKAPLLSAKGVIATAPKVTVGTPPSMTAGSPPAMTFAAQATPTVSAQAVAPTVEKTNDKDLAKLVYTATKAIKN